MRIKLFVPLFIILFISSCALVTDEYQVNQRKVIEYLLEDLPMPDDAEFVKSPSILLGTGNGISGRLVLSSGYSPVENLIFYGNEAPASGWELLSSRVGEEITLVYTKNNRVVTIDMKPTRNLTSFFSGDTSSDIVISLVLPDSIANQNPYGSLNYNNLPEIP